MSHPAADWDQRFLALAAHIATWSKDPSTQVGAVLVDTDRRILGTGYNGLPRGVVDSDRRLLDRPLKLACTLHAEHNAVLFAARPLAGATCYTWPMPSCAHCAAILIQVGIARVVSPLPTAAHWGRWQDDLRLAAELFAEAGVTVSHLELTAPQPLDPDRLP